MEQSILINGLEAPGWTTAICRKVIGIITVRAGIMWLYFLGRLPRDLSGRLIDPHLLGHVLFGEGPTVDSGC